MESSLSISKILKDAEALVQNGAHILDIGAVPTNPSILNALLDPEKELGILYPVLRAIKKEFDSNILISVDTFSPIVAYTLANESLIDIVNDVYGGRKMEELLTNKDTKKRRQIYSSEMKMQQGARERRVYKREAHTQATSNDVASSFRMSINMFDVVAQFSLGYVLMHMSGSLDSLPDTSAEQQSVSEYLEKVLQFFQERKTVLEKKGISFCVFDPGIGAGRFGKNLAQNLALLSKDFIQKLSEFGFPILVGLSRKSFLNDLNPTLIDPQSRDDMSKEWEMRSLAFGVNIIRTHTLYTHRK